LTFKGRCKEKIAIPPQDFLPQRAQRTWRKPENREKLPDNEPEQVITRAGA